MRIAATLAIGLAALPLPALAQTARDVPSGSPLGATASGEAQAAIQRDAQRARLLAATRARANAQALADAFASPTAAPIEDEGRERSTATSTFGVAGNDAPGPRAPSPYGGYYQIRTPWDRR